LINPEQLSTEYLPKIYLKGWGFEKWIINNELYCGKLLNFNKGKKCSFHFHKIKTETFYLEQGLVRIIFSKSDNIESASEVVLKSGMSFHVPVGLRHQIIAVDDSRLFEFSTQHFESDSYRIVLGD
jgi:mannose-6-phosphate isomerase-like protein (cupin superfamily)